MIAIAEAKPRMTMFLCMIYVALTPWHDPQESISSLFIYAITATVTRSRDAEFLATLEAKAARDVGSTATGLLSSVCDAVVHLSKDLQFLEQSSHLASLLLRPPIDIGVGTSFVDLAFDDTEVERLTDFLKRPESNTSTLHVSFKDARGSPVNVQLFHARGVDMDDEPIHIVGVKDDSDEPRAPPEATFRDNPVAQPFTPGGFARIPEDAVSLSGSSSSGLLTDAPSGVLSVHLDPKALGLRVLKCTPEFTSLVGPVGEGVEWPQWVINDADFVSWEQGAFRALMDAHKDRDGEQDIELDVDPFPIRLKLPHMGPRVSEVQANASLRLDVSEAEGGSASLDPLMLMILGDVRYVPRKKRVRPRGPPRTISVL
ncbi:unnamed protein product [Prorocentrum cordatum]|uniref:SMP-LTD domain-containing protein n=1 Tax=Prorocentrum cordatum TaxID=2364126 RepID=A0ABN9PCD9_9DINO|nr:unnamed protein product [Polarella glacialis]